MPTIREEAETTTIRVELEQRSYDVVVGASLLTGLGERIRQLPAIQGSKAAIVTDSTVGPLYAEAVARNLNDAGYQCGHITVPAGEASKSMEEVTRVSREMHQLGLDRRSFVVALGGGVVGDLAGFCAAIFNRGIPFVQLPTTIVSQVDSSVGGKTGVNIPEGKNLLGAFHQPAAVYADTDTLRTLPRREYREGFAEVIKHAAIRDRDMLPQIAAFRDAPDGIGPLIARNVAIKAGIVEEDERETSGTRALLNFGHTIGHGIEAAAGYGQLLHGEAISLGIRAALGLSREIAGLNEAAAGEVLDLLETFELPLQLDSRYETAHILDLLQRDKKFVDGEIRFVLLRELGDAFVSRDVDLKAIERAIDALIVV